MTSQSNPRELFSPFLPSTFVVPEESDRLNAWLGEKISSVSDVVNDKKIGAYTESVTSQNGNKFSYDTTSKVRNGSQYLIRITSFPNTSSATYPVPPEMSPQFVVFQVWGSASKPPSAIGAGNGDFFSFYGEGNSKITFTFSDVAIVVTTTQDMRAYSGFIVIDFIPDGV